MGRFRKCLPSRENKISGNERKKEQAKLSHYHKIDEGRGMHFDISRDHHGQTVPITGWAGSGRFPTPANSAHHSFNRSPIHHQLSIPNQGVQSETRSQRGAVRNSQEQEKNGRYANPSNVLPRQTLDREWYGESARDSLEEMQGDRFLNPSEVQAHQRESVSSLDWERGTGWNKREANQGVTALEKRWQGDVASSRHVRDNERALNTEEDPFRQGTVTLGKERQKWLALENGEKIDDRKPYSDSTGPIRPVSIAIDKSLTEDMTWYRQVQKDDGGTFFSGEVTTHQERGLSNPECHNVGQNRQGESDVRSDLMLSYGGAANASSAQTSQQMAIINQRHQGVIFWNGERTDNSRALSFDNTELACSSQACALPGSELYQKATSYEPVLMEDLVRSSFTGGKDTKGNLDKYYQASDGCNIGRSGRSLPASHRQTAPAHDGRVEQGLVSRKHEERDPSYWLRKDQELWEQAEKRREREEEERAYQERRKLKLEEKKREEERKRREERDKERANQEQKQQEWEQKRREEREKERAYQIEKQRAWEQKRMDERDREKSHQEEKQRMLERREREYERKRQEQKDKERKYQEQKQNEEEKRRREERERERAHQIQLASVTQGHQSHVLILSAAVAAYVFVTTMWRADETAGRAADIAAEERAIAAKAALEIEQQVHQDKMIAEMIAWEQADTLNRWANAVFYLLALGLILLVGVVVSRHRDLSASERNRLGSGDNTQAGYEWIQEGEADSEEE